MEFDNSAVLLKQRLTSYVTTQCCSDRNSGDLLCLKSETKEKIVRLRRFDKRQKVNQKMFASKVIAHCKMEIY